jgi:hypothetical protein
MEFVQIMEFRTQRYDEVSALLDEWEARTEGRRTLQRGTVTRDRDTGNTYVNVLEFRSYEEAMRNSNLPETNEFAQRLAALCEGPPTFRNLDVLQRFGA